MCCDVAGDGGGGGSASTETAPRYLEWKNAPPPPPLPPPSEPLGFNSTSNRFGPAAKPSAASQVAQLGHTTTMPSYQHNDRRRTAPFGALSPRFHESHVEEPSPDDTSRGWSSLVAAKAATARTKSQRQLRAYEAERTRRRTAKRWTARVQREYHEEQRRVYRSMEYAIRAQAGRDDDGDHEEREKRGYAALYCDVDMLTFLKRKGVVEGVSTAPPQARGKDLAMAERPTTTDPLTQESYQGYEQDDFEDDEDC
jgi:hypothetical protein